MHDLVLITPPAVEPVTLAAVRLQVGLSPYDDMDPVKADQIATQLRDMMITARTECETRTRRAFITQTWQMSMDGFHYHPRDYAFHLHQNEILLPKPKFQSIGLFQYIDTTGTLQTLLQDTQYGNGYLGQYSFQLDPGSDSQPARVAPSWLEPWPPTRQVFNGVQIQFTCGYGDTGAAVPAPIKRAILCLAHSYYDPSAFKDIDAFVDGLLNPYANRIA
jgi:uncharacterized phiE125 gp8 family phage protein